MNLRNITINVMFLLVTANIHPESNEGLFLYAPTRAKHVSVVSSTEQQEEQSKILLCKLCNAVQKNNPLEFTLVSTKHFTVMLNIFPYTKGHLLIVAHEHGSTFDTLTKEQRNELIHLISFTTAALKAALQCPGLNVGYNEGRCAGASVPNHLHLHVLPRHEYNEKAFLHTITNTQLIQWNFKELQEQLIPYFANINQE